MFESMHALILSSMLLSAVQQFYRAAKVPDFHFFNTLYTYCESRPHHRSSQLQIHTRQKMKLTAETFRVRPNLFDLRLCVSLQPRTLGGFFILEPFPRIYRRTHTYTLHITSYAMLNTFSLGWKKSVDGDIKNIAYKILK